MKNEETALRLQKDTSEAGERRFVRRVLIVFGIGMAFVALGFLVSYSADVLMLGFASVLLAIVLVDGSRKLQQWLRLPHMLALTAVVVLALAVFGVGGWLMAPQIADQMQELFRTLPDSIRRLETYLERQQWLRDLMGTLPSIDDLLKNANKLVSNAGVIFSGTLGALGNVLIVAFVGIYLAAQPNVYLNGLVTLAPFARRARMRAVLDELGTTLAQWMMGKLLSMILVGIATGVGLALLDVPLALVLGLIAGLLDFIPYIGPLMAAVPGVLIGLSDSPTTGLYVALLFLGVQLAEGYILQPLVENKTVSMPPALTIMMQVLMGSLFGLAGVALATPLTAVIAVLIAMLYVQDVLGDPVKTPAEQD
jgi:predicted PurR-regulated permease PerM